MIRIHRVYDPGLPKEGVCFLVDRLWPRGVKKEALQAQGWLKEVAPSNELRRWYSHDPEKWESFQRRYFKELDAKPEAWRPLLDAARRGDVTLLYSARDAEHNNAVALKNYLDRKVKKTSR